MTLHTLPDVSAFPDVLQDEFKALVQIWNEDRDEDADEDDPALSGDELLSALIEDIEGKTDGIIRLKIVRDAIARWCLKVGINRAVSALEYANTQVSSGPKSRLFGTVDGQRFRFERWLHR